MIVHHQDGTKLGIAEVTTAMYTVAGRVFLAYKSPASGARGLVELSPKEVATIMDCLSSGVRVPDAKIKV